MKSGRIDISWPFDPAQLRDLAPAGIVQFSKPAPSPAQFRKLAAALEEFPKAQLRAYSYGNGYGDKSLSFLKHFPKLRHFVCDLHDVRDLSGLGYLPDDVASISLGEFLDKRVSLLPLTRFQKLKSLSLCDQHTDLEAVLAAMPNLADLSLTRVKLKDLAPLLPLKKLKSLYLCFGKAMDLSLLPKIGRLEYLELMLLKGLADVSVIGELASLKKLVLRSMPKVRALPPFAKLKRLEGVYLDRMKGITDLSPISRVPTLKDVVIVCAMHLNENDFECLKRLPRGCRVRIGTGRQKTNDAVEAMLGRENSEWW